VRRSIILVIAVACLFCAPAAGAAAPFRGLYDEYLRTGVVRGCAHSEAQLQAALTSIPADIQAYDPAFSDALNAALEDRAAGCAAPPPHGASPASGATKAADGSPGPARVSVPSLPPPTASGPSALPVQLAFAGMLASVALLAAAVLVPRRRT
jgi:hypothetical protein